MALRTLFVCEKKDCHKWRFVSYYQELNCRVFSFSKREPKLQKQVHPVLHVSNVCSRSERTGFTSACSRLTSWTARLCHRILTLSWPRACSVSALSSETCRRSQHRKAHCWWPGFHLPGTLLALQVPPFLAQAACPSPKTGHPRAADRLSVLQKQPFCAQTHRQPCPSLWSKLRFTRARQPLPVFQADYSIIMLFFFSFFFMVNVWSIWQVIWGS